jgi:phage tail-like protein
VHKVSDVTLKRGIVNFDSLWAWINETRTAGPAAQKTVAINLLDEAHNPVRTWLLRGCIPMKYTGPTLAGKGGGDVALEEIVLAAEGFEIQA